MQVFRIGPDGIKKIRKKLIIRLVPLLLIGLTIGCFVSIANAKDKEISAGTLTYFVPIYGLFILISLFRALSKQKVLLESYTLTFSENQITRIQLNTPQVSIRFNDIKEIGTLKDGSLMVKGMERSDLICIPSYIEGYSEIHQRLQQILPVSKDSRLPFWIKYQILFSVVIIVSLLAVLLLNNKWVVLICGCIFITTMSWSLIRNRENKNIDNKTKKNAWWILVVMLAVLSMMIMKLVKS